MMATSHALVGAAIAASGIHPLLGAPLILASHFVMDTIPHWDFGTDWKKRSIAHTGMLAIGDTIFAFVITFLLFSWRLPPLILFGAIVLANVPDWLEAPYFIFFASKEGHHKARGGAFGALLATIFKFLEDYTHTRAPFPYGVITQVVTVLFFLLLLH
jgi:hypothetical protein